MLTKRDYEFNGYFLGREKVNGIIDEYKGDVNLIRSKYNKLLTKYLVYYIILCIFLYIIKVLDFLNTLSPFPHGPAFMNSGSWVQSGTT